MVIEQKVELYPFYRDTCLCHMKQAAVLLIHPKLPAEVLGAFLPLSIYSQAPHSTPHQVTGFPSDLGQANCSLPKEQLAGEKSKRIYTPLAWDVSWWNISTQCPLTPSTFSVISRHYRKCSALHATIYSSFLNFNNL